MCGLVIGLLRNSSSRQCGQQHKSEVFHSTLKADGISQRAMQAARNVTPPNSQYTTFLHVLKVTFFYSQNPAVLWLKDFRALHSEARGLPPQNGAQGPLTLPKTSVRWIGKSL
jgi:hypothetical protein